MPAGWTLKQGSNNTTALRSEIWWYRATGSESGTFTVTRSGGGAAAVSLYVDTQVVTAGDPFDVISATNNVAATTVSANSVTTTINGNRVYFLASSAPGSTNTAVTEWTQSVTAFSAGTPTFTEVSDRSLDPRPVLAQVTQGNNAGGSTVGAVGFTPTATGVAFACITARTTTTTITNLNGWTLADTRSDGTNAVTFTLWRTCTENIVLGSVTLSASVKASCVMGVVTNCNTTTPFQQLLSQANASSTTSTAPAITPTVANTLVLAYSGTASGTTSSAQGAGYTEVAESATSGGSGGTRTSSKLTRRDTRVAASTSTGTTTITWGAAATNVGVHMAFNPVNGNAMPVHHALGTGEMATAGATGARTATLSVSALNQGLLFALKKATASAFTQTVTASMTAATVVADRASKALASSTIGAAGLGQSKGLYLYPTSDGITVDATTSPVGAATRYEALRSGMAYVYMPLPTVTAAFSVVFTLPVNVVSMTAIVRYKVVSVRGTPISGYVLSSEFDFDGAPVEGPADLDGSVGVGTVKEIQASIAFVPGVTTTEWTVVQSDLEVEIYEAYLLVTVSAGGTQFNSTVSGAITPATLVPVRPFRALAASATVTTALADRLVRTLSAFLNAAATVVRQSARVVTASVATSAAVSRRFARSISASVTATSTVIRVFTRALAASLTLSATIAAVKTFLRTVSASLAPSGAVVRYLTRSLTASVTAAATVSRQMRRSVAASLTPSATVATLKTLLRTVTASLTAAATVARQATKAAAGSVTSAATVARQQALQRSLTASVTVAAAAGKQLFRTTTASVTPTATVLKRFARSVAASLIVAATVARQMTKAVTGSVTSTATVARQQALLRTVTASLTAATSVSRQMARAVAASLTPSTTVAALKTFLRSVSAAVTPSTTVTDQLRRTVGGSVTVASMLTRVGLRSVQASLAVTGAVTRRLTRSLAASLTPSATVAALKTFLRSLAASVTPAATLAEQSRKSVVSNLTLTGALGQSNSITLLPDGTISNTGWTPVGAATAHAALAAGDADYIQSSTTGAVVEVSLSDPAYALSLTSGTFTVRARTG